jgi:hydrogenase nickel incorporation protein HypA/HybF
MCDALAIALERAAAQGARAIHRIALRIGPLSGVVPEAMSLAFEVAAAGTIAEGARLEIKEVPLVCECGACGNAFEANPMDYDCPRCLTPGARVIQGHELELASLEVS